MAYFRTSIDVLIAADEAFAFLADFSNAASWDPGVAEARRLDEGPLAVGCEFRLVADFFGRRLPLTYRITQLDAPTRVVFEAESSDLHAVDAITLEKADGGTRVLWDATLSLKGLRYVADLPLHLAFQWIGGRAVEGLEKALNDLAKKDQAPDRQGRSGASTP